MGRFSFRTKDRDSIVILLVIIMACVVLFPFLTNTRDEASGRAGKYNGKANGDGAYYAQPGANDGSHVAETACELFPFDPNTADSTAFLRLGLQPWQVRNIYKYRSRGGRYRRKEDFARLYGLTLKKYRQLEPYIVIGREPMAADYIKSGSGRALPSERTVSVPTAEKYPASRVKKLRPGEKIDINTADTAELQRIPGIGSYFAQRIVDLRKRRQAFVSPEELLQGIRNFPETALCYMTASQNFPKVRINRLTQKELASHPLINYTQARDIIALRRTTGTIHSVDDLSALPSFRTDQLNRLKPFLVFD